MTTEEIARVSRIRALEMVHRAQAAHIGSSLSCIDLLSVLYSRLDPLKALRDQSEVILISKGHAAAGVYAVMSAVGLLSDEVLKTFCRDGGVLSGHVTAGDYVEFSTGSLGHALPYGLGRALAIKKRQGAQRVHVLLSDGECDEGSNWEAALIASHLELNNLKVLVDRNFLQSLDSTEETIRLEPLADKWRAFGWNVSNFDGHNHADIQHFLNTSFPGPAIGIAKTTKGFGVSFMENSVMWHYKSPNLSELQRALKELEHNA